MTENSQLTLNVYCKHINDALKALTAEKPYLR